MQDRMKKVVDLQDFVPQRSSTPKQVTKHPSPREGLGGPSSSPPRWATADAQAYTTVENNAIKNRMNRLFGNNFVAIDLGCISVVSMS